MPKTSDTSPPRRVTAAEVAERAGVSISTVSKALSGRGAVRYETRQRVLEAARDLNYQSNEVAVSLLAGKTNTVGVITSDRLGRLTSPVLLGATETLAEHEIALLLCDGRGDRIREQYFVDSFLRRRVDGILVTGSGIFGRDTIRVDLPIPVVYAMAWSKDSRDASVVPDDGAGARSAAEHLLATGRTKIAFVSGRRDDATTIRLANTREVLTSSGLRLAHEPLIGQWSEGWGRQAGLQLLKSGVDFDGVVCGNDQIARGVVESLRENGVAVPQAVGVIGFDNWDVMVEASRPPLSSVDLSLHEVGQAAARTLVEAIGGDGMQPGVRRVACHVVPRESTSTA
ncbi:LacI family DNA-binding transcriptional regulator [Rugosimonospora acidiphila]|uniref:LacI family DNA-binding transcriptional regulator n=1 Tax=Rugosimonospora acidiphila TaxID=556531 RepID=A0ABP9S5Q7_9ACTN